jgi:hypothetical protein
MAVYYDSLLNALSDFFPPGYGQNTPNFADGLLSEGLLGSVSNPFTSLDDVVIRKRKFVVQDDALNLLTTTLGGAPVQNPFIPFSDTYLPSRRRNPALFEQQQNLLGTVFGTVAPFTSADYYLPVRRRVFIDFDTPNLLTSTLTAPAQIPFTPGQIENPLPKRSRVPYLPDGTNNLAAATFIQPLPQVQVSTPDNPPIRKRIIEQDPVNLLNSTLALFVVQNPFVPFDYTVIQKRRFVVIDDTANLLPLTAVQQLPFSNDYQVTFKRRFVLDYDPSNLLPLTQPVPFVTTEYQYHARRRSLTAYEQTGAFNLATATWVPPALPPASGEQVYPQIRHKILPDYYVNLLTTTLAPSAPIQLISDPVYTVSFIGLPRGGRLPYTVTKKNKL